MQDKKIDAKMREAIKNMYLSGASIDVISLQTNVDIPTVLQFLKEMELGEPDVFFCLRFPYFESVFTDKDALSKHIDRIHVGSGLLEGDFRKW